jgi:hypothetical protein
MKAVVLCPANVHSLARFLLVTSDCHNIFGQIHYLRSEFFCFALVLSTIIFLTAYQVNLASAVVITSHYHTLSSQPILFVFIANV